MLLMNSGASSNAIESIGGSDLGAWRLEGNPTMNDNTWYYWHYYIIAVVVAFILSAALPFAGLPSEAI